MCKLSKVENRIIIINSTQFMVLKISNAEQSKRDLICRHRSNVTNRTILYVNVLYVTYYPCTFPISIFTTHIDA